MNLEPYFCALHHVSVIVRDLEASRHFYCDVLGMEEVHRPKPFNFKGQWFRKNGYEIHTVHVDEAVQAPGDAENNPTAERDVTFARHFCFSVSDVDVTVATLEEYDIPLAAGPRPRGDGATQMYVYDPDGHMVELVYEPWDWE